MNDTLHSFSQYLISVFEKDKELSLLQYAYNKEVIEDALEAYMAKHQEITSYMKGGEVVRRGGRKRISSSHSRLRTSCSHPDHPTTACELPTSHLLCRLDLTPTPFNSHTASPPT